MSLCFELWDIVAQVCMPSNTFIQENDLKYMVTELQFTGIFVVVLLFSVHGVQGL